MPALNESNVRHLLRRTEFVDRSDRVAQLLSLSSMSAAVDNVLAFAADPGSVVFRPADENWQRGQHLTHFWLDRMAHDSSRPFQERLAFFWHGHFCSELSKVGSAELMREQIDLWRRSGAGNVRALVTEMSTQVAMIRYLDNNENRATSPNQNFARELLELFLIGVGNYTEADVEAGTAAWTGHTDQWNDEVAPYRWRPEWHDSSAKAYLGQTINVGGDPRLHGKETIDVVLGPGVVPAGAAIVANRGRPTREVAAEFLSRKLWVDLASDVPPAAAIATMRDALLAADFDIVPWVRAMLLCDDFYSGAVKSGHVRSPVEWIVALLVATGRRSEQTTPTWLMDGMGQALLYPPDVSGWKTNGYWVNASAMESRARAAQQVAWRASDTYWDEGGAIHLAGGSVTRAELIARNPDRTPVMSGAEVVDRLLGLMDLELPASRSALIAHVDAGSVWERNDALFLALLAPELHLA